MIDAGIPTLKMPRCRYCGEPFMSWWPRERHEATCPAQRQLMQERRADAERKLAQEEQRKRRNALARWRRARHKRARLDLKRYHPEGRRKDATPFPRPTCVTCQAETVVPYTGDGRGNVTSFYCIVCREVTTKNSGRQHKIVVEQGS